MQLVYMCVCAALDWLVDCNVVIAATNASERDGAIAWAKATQELVPLDFAMSHSQFTHTQRCSSMPFIELDPNLRLSAPIWRTRLKCQVCLHCLRVRAVLSLTAGTLERETVPYQARFYFSFCKHLHDVALIAFKCNTKHANKIAVSRVERIKRMQLSYRCANRDRTT